MFDDAWSRFDTLLYSAKFVQYEVNVYADHVGGIRLRL
jgi:hypothetical protein